MSNEQPCYWCGLPSTHLCTACGKFICDNLLCKLKSGEHVVAHPIQSARRIFSGSVADQNVANRHGDPFNKRFG